ncbi:MAG: hypothetical protein JKY08_11980 [Flavobacteriaceae bacterium]|nr:hypothetical protein [Flavobacteriaceae bacterium]
MKYRQLSKEQFEALHEEFATFLATQKIDVAEWNRIKTDNPSMADEELDVFSDTVWENVLAKTDYLEHFSEQSINLFKCNQDQIHRIVIEVKKEGINLMEQKGFQWFFNNSNDDEVSYYKASKTYEKDRNPEVFDLIEKGANITNGELFEAMSEMLAN